MMTLTAELFIDSRCTLGEGPFWHPSRGELFWFDIEQFKLHRASASGEMLDTHTFDEFVAAAALVDHDRLLIAAASGLLEYSISEKTVREVLSLEADNPVTRTNDSRVSPHGAWWVSTMNKDDAGKDGSVYWFRDGQVETLMSNVGIPNAICFSPDGRFAYFADTPTQQIRRAELDIDTGKPAGPWEMFVDLTERDAFPDGAVVDSAGCLWNAEYGSGQVRRYTPDGEVDRIVEVSAKATTCPAFGGSDLKTLYITTAGRGVSEADRGKAPYDGAVFAIELDIAGQAETPVRYLP